MLLGVLGMGWHGVFASIVIGVADGMRQRINCRYGRRLWGGHVGKAGSDEWRA